MEIKWHSTRQIAAACIVAAAFLALCFIHKSPTQANPSHSLYPIRGIDISAHNGEIDFERVAADSITFALIKATEGASFKDPRFIANYLAAKKAGIKVSAYHFFRFDIDGTIQALNFINSIGRLSLDLPVAVDIEEWTNPGNIPTDITLARLDSLVVHLFRSGYRVMLYSNKNGHHRFIKSRSSKLPMWICSLSEAPSDIDWIMWQYTHRGRVNGIRGAVDINVYNGSVDDWEQWIIPDSISR